MTFKIVITGIKPGTRPGPAGAKLIGTDWGDGTTRFDTRAEADAMCAKLNGNPSWAYKVEDAESLDPIRITITGKLPESYIRVEDGRIVIDQHYEGNATITIGKNETK